VYVLYRRCVRVSVSCTVQPASYRPYVLLGMHRSHSITAAEPARRAAQQTYSVAADSSQTGRWSTPPGRVEYSCWTGQIGQASRLTIRAKQVQAEVPFLPAEKPEDKSER
jgi:hypothetical protein